MGVGHRKGSGFGLQQPTDLPFSMCVFGDMGRICAVPPSNLQHPRGVFTPCFPHNHHPGCPLCFSGPSWRKDEHQYSYLGFPKESGRGTSSLAVMEAITQCFLAGHKPWRIDDPFCCPPVDLLFLSHDWLGEGGQSSPFPMFPLSLMGSPLCQGKGGLSCHWSSPPAFSLALESSRLFIRYRSRGMGHFVCGVPQPRGRWFS